MLAAEDREFLGTIVRSMLGRLLELIGLMHGQPVPTSDASYLAKPHVRRKLDRLVAITWLQGRLDSMLVAEGRAARRFGASYADIVSSRDGPLLVHLLTESSAALDTSGATVRRAEAQALYREGLTMEQIAEHFGVSRQRVSALLRKVRH